MIEIIDAREGFVILEDGEGDNEGITKSVSSGGVVGEGGGEGRGGFGGKISLNSANSFSEKDKRGTVHSMGSVGMKRDNFLVIAPNSNNNDSDALSNDSIINGGVVGDTATANPERAALSAPSRPLAAAAAVAITKEYENEEELSPRGLLKRQVVR